MQVEEKLMEYLNVLQMRILFCGKKKKKMLISRYLIKEIINELRVSLKLTVEKEKSNCKQNFDAFVQL